MLPDTSLVHKQHTCQITLERKGSALFDDSHTGPSTPTETKETAATKNKKKEKISKTQKALISSSLGSSFSLTPISEESLTQRHSLFTENFCPKLNTQECALAVTIIQGSAPCKNMNLFEVFIADFLNQWRLIISNATALNVELMKELGLFHAKNNIYNQMHHLYLYIYGNEKKDLGIDVQLNYHPKFFMNESSAIKWLENYSCDLQNFIDSIEKRKKQLSNLIPSCKSIKTLHEVHERYKITLVLLKNLQILQQKALLMGKLLSTDKIWELFVNTKISSWTEFSNASEKLIPGSQFNFLIKKFISIRGSVTANNVHHEKYVQVIEQMISEKFSKTSIAKSLAAYKDYSHTSVITLLYLLKCLARAQKDPLYNHHTFCRDTKMKCANQYPEQKEFIAFLHYLILSSELEDKLLNDLNLTMNDHFLIELKKFNLTIPQSYIKRLLKMISLSINDDLTDNLLPLETHSNLLRKIQVEIVKLVQTANLEIKSFISDLPLESISEELNIAFSDASFRLSHCLLAINPIYEALSKSKFIMPKFDYILEKVLQIIKIAKQDGEIDFSDIKKLKSQISELLQNLLFPLCVNIIIVTDTKALFTQNLCEDILNILPKDILRILNLKGFDAIFLEINPPATITTTPKEVITTPAANIVTETQAAPKNSTTSTIVPLPATASKKEKKQVLTTQASLTAKTALTSQNITPPKKEIPDKQAFKDAKNRRTIGKILSIADFEYEKTGRHDNFRHRITGKRIPVPNDVSDLGTRMALFRLMHEALEQVK